ncbi:MAG: hypothetical protein SPL89_03745 [Clostridia bacterium]|nr:hypothetical protein [Clostridia bacterium]
MYEIGLSTFKNAVTEDYLASLAENGIKPTVFSKQKPHLGMWE